MNMRTDAINSIARALSENGAAVDWSHAMQSAEAAMDAAEGGPSEEPGFELFPFVERLAFARNALEQIAQGRVRGYDAAQALCWDTLDAMDAIGGCSAPGDEDPNFYSGVEATGARLLKDELEKRS